MTRLIAGLAVLILCGCASTPLTTDDSWRLVGKLSLRTENESRILGIDWRQDASTGEISLTGPLGVRVAAITTSESELTINAGGDPVTVSEGDVIYAENLGALYLPWGSLSDWVRGTSGDQVETGNWHFRITESGPDGPMSMSLDHPEVSLKLKVRRWEIAI